MHTYIYTHVNTHIYKCRHTHTPLQSCLQHTHLSVYFSQPLRQRRVAVPAPPLPPRSSPSSNSTTYEGSKAKGLEFGVSNTLICGCEFIGSRQHSVAACCSVRVAACCSGHLRLQIGTWWAAVYCSVLQRVAGCCSVLQRFAACCSMLQHVAACCSMLQFVAACCSMLQCVAACCSVLQCVAVCCSVLQCVAVCCSVSYARVRIHTSVGQEETVCCSVLHCDPGCCSVSRSVAVRYSLACSSMLQRVALC